MQQYVGNNVTLQNNQNVLNLD